MYKSILVATTFAVCTCFSSCNKENNINLSIGDLAGTWETEYFEKPPVYGPITIEINGNYTMRLHYLIDKNDGNPFGVYENCEFTIDGNEINNNSYHGYSATVFIKEFTGSTMKFLISGGELEMTLEAKKIK